MRTSQRLLIILLAVAWLSHAGTLILKRAWVDKFKDRATIDATFTIDHAHKTANPAVKDGDMHVSGRAAKEIGLPMVAEVMNAREADQKAAIDLIHAREGKNQPVAMTGAWRLWFEHPPSSGAQTQFAAVPVPANTNPDHCFEIHPVTSIDTIKVPGSLHHVEGFPAKEAKAAFASYEKLSVRVQANKTAVTLDSAKSGFNYVLFTMRIKGKVTKLLDGGLAVIADVLADDEDSDTALAQDIRMVFVPDSPPHKKLAAGLDSDKLTVLGIPRVNLNAVGKFLGTSNTVGPVTRKLPYEIIVVALEGDNR
jgi:hypothetical protein